MVAGLVWVKAIQAGLGTLALLGVAGLLMWALRRGLERDQEER